MKSILVLAIFTSILINNVYTFNTILKFHNRIFSTKMKNSLLLSMKENPYRPISDDKYYWDLSKFAFSLLPLSPSRRRKTLMEEIVKDSIWTLDQVQGIINVNVPVRSTIIKLKEGGLFVYNPVAPTKECIEIVRNLELKYGKVKHIVLGTIGLEHKALCGPFSQYFPSATIWLQPGQWSFPLNLPNIFLGFPFKNIIKEIPSNDKNDNDINTIYPWGQDFDFAVLSPLKFKSVGGFSETAIYHKASKTLLVTDIIVKVVDQPSPILLEDPRAILYHSKDNMLAPVIDNEETRLKGWRRMLLFSLVFFPGNIKVSSFIDTILDIPKVSEESKIFGEDAVPISGGLYPWSWIETEKTSFQSLQGGLLVAPILSELILNREPNKVLIWVNKICKWNIQRIIPCHLENNIKTNSIEFRKAFDFLIPNNINSLKDNNNNNNNNNNNIFNLFNKQINQNNNKIPKALDKDIALLKFTSNLFTKLNIVAPSEI